MNQTNLTENPHLIFKSSMNNPIHRYIVILSLETNVYAETFMQVLPRYSSYSYVIESDYITKVKHISDQ